MDSESAERSWASLDSPSISAREMGPGARRNSLDEHCRVRAATAERRRLQENCPKQEEWMDAVAIAAWNAAFESIHNFYDLDAPCHDNNEPGYVEIDSEELEREWVESKPGDPEPFPVSCEQYQRMLALMPKSGTSKKRLPKIKLFATPEMEVKMEEID
ncbi:hypothetical protein B0H13DRAFT_2340154 [Mycena leptocephala]|nr:hypothetical protein B0H13DRAFT_2340154 [Mycena leptocephala]